MHKPDKPRKASAKKRAKDVRFTEKANKVQESLKREMLQPDAAKVPHDEPAVKDVRLKARGKKKAVQSLRLSSSQLSKFITSKDRSLLEENLSSRPWSQDRGSHRSKRAPPGGDLQLCLNWGGRWPPSGRGTRAHIVLMIM